MKTAVSFAIISIFALILAPGCQKQAKQGDSAVNPPAKAPQTQANVQARQPAAKPAETKAQPEPAKPAEIPGQIKFESVVHDFGNIDPNTKNRAEFRFTNVGKGTLKLQPVQVTCGCTVTELTKLEYAPGESGVIKFQYTASKAAGPVTKTMFVPSNDPQNPRVELTLKANIVIQVDYKPQDIKFSMHEQNAGAPPIIITSKDGRPFRIKGFESSSNVVSIDYDPNKTDTKFVIPLKVDTEKLKSTLNGYIRFDITHPGIDVITIPYSTPTEFEARPSAIILRDAKPGQAIEREIWIQNNYNRPFEVDSVSSKSGIIKVLKQEKQDQMVKLVVNVVPPQEQKKLFFTDTLVVKTKDGAEVLINCRGFFSRTAK
jgi:hypothetical protein